jgi:tRNA(Phe) wybutosine-synthesizing methylase Tyw3
MEPPILAICCRDLSHAQYLLDLARGYGGLKNCGIRGTKGGKFMVALVDTAKIETLVAMDGEILTTETYLETLFEYSKKKLVASRARFSRLQEVLKHHLEPKNPLAALSSCPLGDKEEEEEI